MQVVFEGGVPNAAPDFIFHGMKATASTSSINRSFADDLTLSDLPTLRDGNWQLVRAVVLCKFHMSVQDTSKSCY